MVSPFRGSGPFRGRGPFLGRGPWAGKAPWGFNLGGVAWTPATLFASGEAGAWYDPSDLNTLWQDSAGTTPVTAVEQPVGLMLDKSRGLVLGSELVTNGDFTTDTAWTKGSGWTIADGIASRSNVAAISGISQTVTATQGRFYQITITAIVTSGSIIGIRLGTTSQITPTISASGTYTYRVACDGTNNLLNVVAQTNFVGSIDNISVRELAGNHAFNPNATTVRPVLSARYNLFERTEEFENAYWTKTNTAVTSNAAVAPNGTTTADLLYPSTSGTSRTVSKALLGQLTGATYTTSVRLKAADIGFAYIFNVQGNSLLYVNLTTGATSNVGANINNLTSSIDTSGWVTVSFNSTLAIGSTANMAVGPCDAAGSTQVTANGTDGIYIWGADLRVANESATIPYQRVTTSTDYDATPGTFPYYLRFDGSDDWLQTASIDFTATDKMSVFAGVRKLSDAAAAMLLELGTNYANQGFAILGPGSAAANYGFGVDSVEAAYSRLATTYAAPTTDVLSAFYSQTAASGAASALVSAKVNGAVPTLSTPGGTYTGTGAFANAALYIGRRGGTSTPYNGRLYSLCVLGRTATAAEIASAESYVAARTGVTL